MRRPGRGCNNLRTVDDPADEDGRPRRNKSPSLHGAKSARGKTGEPHRGRLSGKSVHSCSVLFTFHHIGMDSFVFNGREIVNRGGICPMRETAGRCKMALMVVVIALLLATAGCGSGASQPSSSTQATPGQLSATPASIAFGNVTVNGATSQNVKLSNAGGSSLTISSLSASGAGFQVSGLAVPMTLASGQTTSFSVMFDPSSTGPAAGSVQITTSGGNAPLTIALSGDGVSSPSPNSHAVDLNWLASPSAVIGYNIYRGNQSGGPYTQTNSSVIPGTTFSDSAVTAGQTYWYVVTAVAADGAESVHSNEAMATVPTP